MEGSAGSRGGGMMCQYLNGRIGDNMGTIAVDNVKWIGGPWLKYRVGLACGIEVEENITGRKWKQQWVVPHQYGDGWQDC